VRENEKEVVILDAGDLLFKKFFKSVSGNEVKPAIEKARLIVESLNVMGYDAVGIGDDDLTLGKDPLMEIAKSANFPFLSSNILDETSEKPLFKPYLLKEVNGVRIGIFSLLSPDFFHGPSDHRKKGLVLRPPVETAQAMVNELRPKTDLIILLSHLGYSKDMELARAVQGIHVIVGSHTGINLVYPPVINGTIILQTGPKGMQAGKLHLTLFNSEPTFYNMASRRTLEDTLDNINNRLAHAGISEVDKAQWQKSKGEAERTLQQFEGKDEFTNTILSLGDQMKDHPDISKMVGEYKAKYPETGKTHPGQ
jgi:2',3'-cyclic-nucleotide 2'-phosphodiesterase (5'-nucleotidase family)